MQTLAYGMTLVLTLGLAACGSDQKAPEEPEGPMEEAGAEVDEAAEEAADETEEAAEEIEEEADEAVGEDEY